MKRVRAILGSAAFVMAAFGPPDGASAQSGDFYAGKTMKVIVGLDAGGTVDTFVRTFSVYLKKHIAGNPTILVQNMPGAGGWGATNYLFEKAAPDGLTILYGPWDPLAQALGDQGLRARYEKFEFLGGTGDIRINYIRRDSIPGGAKQPSDIMKAENMMVGALNKTDISGLLAHLSLDVLGVKHKVIVGYRGGNDIFLAMQRGEVQLHNTSISTFRSRGAGFVKSGEGLGVSYFVPVERNGTYEKSKFIAEMPAFPELYQRVHGKMPSGHDWDAMNWLTNQTGELTFVALAPHGTPPEAVAALRIGFQEASEDPEFINESMARNGVPFSYVNVERGQAVFRSLAEVSPDVLATLRKSIGTLN
jgi:tripartite-type tricarboxylate transporter receptor subunit TctC